MRRKIPQKTLKKPLKTPVPGAILQRARRSVGQCCAWNSTALKKNSVPIYSRARRKGWVFVRKMLRSTAFGDSRGSDICMGICRSNFLQMFLQMLGIFCRCWSNIFLDFFSFFFMHFLGHFLSPVYYEQMSPKCGK